MVIPLMWCYHPSYSSFLSIQHRCHSKNSAAPLISILIISQPCITQPSLSHPFQLSLHSAHSTDESGAFSCILVLSFLSFQTLAKNNKSSLLVPQSLCSEIFIGAAAIPFKQLESIEALCPCRKTYTERRHALRKIRFQFDSSDIMLHKIISFLWADILPSHSQTLQLSLNAGSVVSMMSISRLLLFFHRFSVFLHFHSARN